VSLKVGNLLNAGRRVFKDVSEGEWPEAELSKLRVIEGVDADKTLLFSYAKKSKFWRDQYEQERIVEVAAALGERLCEEVLLLCE